MSAKKLQKLIFVVGDAGCSEAGKPSGDDFRRRHVSDIVADLLATSLREHLVLACCCVHVGWPVQNRGRSFHGAVCVQAGALNHFQGGWEAVKECLHKAMAHGRVLILLENAEDALSCPQTAQVCFLAANDLCYTHKLCKTAVLDCFSPSQLPRAPHVPSR